MPRFNFPQSHGTVPAWLSTDPEQVRHALSSKEGWRQFVARKPQRPRTYTVRQLNALTDQQRQTYDQARIEFHRSLVIVRHSQLADVWTKMQQVVEGQYADDGPGMGVALSGGPSHGKTAALTGFLRLYERELRQAQPEAFDQECEFIPVAYSSLLRGSGLRAQMRHILDFYGHPYSASASGADLVTEVVRVLNKCRTKILALDQAQNLRSGDRRDEEVAANLKEIMDNTQVSLILCGINIKESGPLAVERTGRRSMDRLQLARRFAFVSIERIKRDNVEWPALLSAIENNLVLLKAQPGDLSQTLQEVLWDMAQGAIGVAFNLIRVAANAAIRDTSERITLRLLERTAPTIEVAGQPLRRVS